MASELFVDNITGKTGTSGGAPITLSGDTATLGSGVTGSAVPMHFISKGTASNSAYIEFSNLSNHSSFKNLYFI